MIIIDQLKEEHKSILQMLEVLEAVCKKLEAGENINKDDLFDMVTFIKEFADKSHHLKEEDMLFPAMVKAGIPKEGGPIGVMLSEHNTGREFVKGMSTAIENLADGSSNASSSFTSNARDYIQLLSTHIYKEDNILYPMAESRISQENQNKLLKEFEIVDKEKIGLETLKEMISNLNRLIKMYL